MLRELGERKSPNLLSGIYLSATDVSRPEKSLPQNGNFYAT